MMHETDKGARALRTDAHRSLTLAVIAAFLFTLGGVANWAQEFVAWVPRRVADTMVICGLALSVWALALVARRMFAGGAFTRGEKWIVVRSVFFAALPPVIFLVWWVWARWMLAELV